MARAGQTADAVQALRLRQLRPDARLSRCAGGLVRRNRAASAEHQLRHDLRQHHPRCGRRCHAGRGRARLCRPGECLGGKFGLSHGSRPSAGRHQPEGRRWQDHAGHESGCRAGPARADGGGGPRSARLCAAMGWRRRAALPGHGQTDLGPLGRRRASADLQGLSAHRARLSALARQSCLQPGAAVRRCRAHPRTALAGGSLGQPAPAARGGSRAHAKPGAACLSGAQPDRATQRPFGRHAGCAGRVRPARAAGRHAPPRHLSRLGA